MMSAVKALLGDENGLVVDLVDYPPLLVCQDVSFFTG